VSQTMAVLAKLDTPVMQILARLALCVLLVLPRVLVMEHALLVPPVLMLMLLE